MTQIDYVVNSIVMEKVSVETTYRGKPITAHVDGFIVELLNRAEGMDHGHNFKFIPEGDEEMQRMREMFTPGRYVTVRFEASSEQPKPDEHSEQPQQQT